MFKCIKCGKFIWSIKNSTCNDCIIAQAVEARVAQAVENRVAQAVEDRLKAIKKQETEEARSSENQVKQSSTQPLMPDVLNEEVSNIPSDKAETFEPCVSIQETTIPQEASKAIYPSFEGFTLSREQTDAFGRIENTPYNYFVTGNAGTGKSVVLRYFIKNTSKNVVVLAPTGIAAINVGGETIHSFFKLGATVQNTHDIDEIRQNLAKDVMFLEKLRRTQAIVIDEISMVRCDVMDMIDTKLKIAKNNNLPFGGCQIIAFGDLYQLPPVVNDRKDDHSISEYIRDHYSSEFFFGAPVVRNAPFIKIQLTQTHRQNDQEFIEKLNAIRLGINNLETINYINNRANADPSDENTITIAPHRATVNRINKEKLDAINSVEYEYQADVDNMQEFTSERDRPAELLLKLKVGAQVMMQKNDNKHHRWVNGTIGIVTQLLTNSIKVRIKGAEYNIDKETWTKYRYQYDKQTRKLERQAVGKFTQFPVRLAYAITIHKSQGQTYDKVSIDYSSGRSFASGQTYVALSRCKTIEGISLSVPLNPDDVKVSSQVEQYMHDQEQSQYDYAKVYGCGSSGGAQLPIRRYSRRSH